LKIKEPETHLILHAHDYDDYDDDDDNIMKKCGRTGENADDNIIQCIHFPC
jgi:hypothetical protein